MSLYLKFRVALSGAISYQSRFLMTAKLKERVLGKNVALTVFCSAQVAISHYSTTSLPQLKLFQQNDCCF